MEKAIYMNSILTILTWPVLILLSYLLIRFALKRFEKLEKKREEAGED